MTLVHALEDADLSQARNVLGRFRDALPSSERRRVDEEFESGETAD
jgi:tritrans,polycis-undecaprenyl-diphosphate synthase [geranylgeranyl-diphosphate specific]